MRLHRRRSRWRWPIRIVMGATGLFGGAALHYSTIEPGWLGTLLGLLLVVTCIVCAARFRSPVALLVWGVVTIVFVAWYATDPPLNDRAWEDEYAVLPTVQRDGDAVHVGHIRNFTYKSDGGHTAAYYDADFDLRQLTTLDLVTSYWAGDRIAHVFLSFGFSDGRHLAISIETRRQVGFPYSAIAGFFHHYELFYVVADERDLIGVRTDIRRERVYLYRVVTTPDVIRTLLLSYLDAVGKLATTPEWYNTLTDNCTTGILARANENTDIALRYNWRVLLSGYAAEYAYRLGMLNQTMPFADLMRASRVARPPGGAIDPDFSAEIRKGLPL